MSTPNIDRILLLARQRASKTRLPKKYEGFEMRYLGQEMDMTDMSDPNDPRNGLVELPHPERPKK
jgi:hypothetical protein